MAGVARASKHAGFILTGPGTRKQSPSWLMFVAVRAQFNNCTTNRVCQEPSPLGISYADCGHCYVARRTARTHLLN